MIIDFRSDTVTKPSPGMLDAMMKNEERFVTALGNRQYRRMVLRMRAARAGPLLGWALVVRSWLI